MFCNEINVLVVIINSNIFSGKPAEWRIEMREHDEDDVNTIAPFEVIYQGVNNTFVTEIPEVCIFYLILKLPIGFTKLCNFVNKDYDYDY